MFSSRNRPIFHDYDPSKPDDQAPPNRKNILTSEPVYQRSYRDVNGTVTGHLYQIQTEVQQVPILHLYGNPHEMGYAQGNIRTLRFVSKLIKLK